MMLVVSSLLRLEAGDAYYDFSSVDTTPWPFKTVLSRLRRSPCNSHLGISLELTWFFVLSERRGHVTCDVYWLMLNVTLS